jgi:hypothetical protein
MGANVFANGLEVSCEKADNQSLASMPDVCLSPPSPPAGPVPVPYPNFSSASDTTDGTKTVQIAGGQVGMKNKSCYKQSKGDEAATRSLGMGVTTGCIQGKNYFVAWSSDVKFEGENAIRLSDLTGSNHASPAACTANTTASTGKPAPPDSDPECEQLRQRNQDKREATESADVSDSKKDAITGPGTTISSAKFTPAGGGRPTVVSAPNRNDALDACPGEFVAGGDMEDRHDNISNLCPEAGH